MLLSRFRLLRPLTRGAVLVSITLAAFAQAQRTEVPAAPEPPTWQDTMSPWLGSAGRPGNDERKQPFRIFDNVYYVGLHWVSAYLITTSDGLVLIDATYGDTVDQVVTNIRQLGFDPADIRYVIVSHGHRDHYAGAGEIVRLSGAQVVLSAHDWGLVEEQQASGLARSGLPLKRDIEARDNQTLRVGDTTFRFYLSPGHTAGSLSLQYTARDGDKTYRVLHPGGLGFNFGPDRTAAYVKSHERLKQLGPWDSVLANHPHMGARDLLLLETPLRERAPGDPHPANLGAAATNAWFDQILTSARDKLSFESPKQ